MSFFRIANGGMSGPVSTGAEKAFSQIGLALLISPAGETVGVRAGVCVAVGAEVAVGVGNRISVDRTVGVLTGIGVDTA
jgi:hypothetical protein